jgi:hypothetical protein
MMVKSKRMRLTQGTDHDAQVDAWIEIDAEGKPQFFVAGIMLDAAEVGDQEVKGPCMRVEVDRDTFDVVLRAKVAQTQTRLDGSLGEIELYLRRMQQAMGLE